MLPTQVWAQAYKLRYGTAPSLGLNDRSAIGKLHEYVRIRGKDGDAFLRGIIAAWPFSHGAILPSATLSEPADAKIIAADDKRIIRAANHVGV